MNVYCTKFIKNIYFFTNFEFSQKFSVKSQNFLHIEIVPIIYEWGKVEKFPGNKILYRFTLKQCVMVRGPNGTWLFLDCTSTAGRCSLIVRKYLLSSTDSQFQIIKIILTNLSLVCLYFFLQGLNMHENSKLEVLMNLYNFTHQPNMSWPTSCKYWKFRYYKKVPKVLPIFHSVLASNWYHMMADGAKFLISCHWLKLLSKASCWHRIQNLEPSTNVSMASMWLPNRGRWWAKFL